jgi:anti-sigma regulatory factor (Ser/Thr protein kinase)
MGARSGDHTVRLQWTVSLNGPIEGRQKEPTGSDIEVRPETSVRRLPPVPTSVAEARSFVESTLSSCLRPDALDGIVLVVSELMSNAVAHATAPVEISVRSDEPIRVEIFDDSPKLPVKCEPEPTATSGRGLAIVERMCERSGVHVTDNGKCVWCEFGSDSIRS